MTSKTPTTTKPTPALQITDIDRSKCTRVVPMQILCLGLCRTGTESLTTALRILGFNEAYHGYQAIQQNPRDCEMWMRGLRAKYDGEGKVFGREEFDMLLGHCQAVCDIPAICFAPELIEAYPEAKVILTVRDVDEWHASMLQISTFIASPIIKYLIAPALQTLSTICHSRFRWVQPTLHKAGLALFTTDMQNNGKHRFEEHYAMVEALVPPERLLKYHVREGWEPLCTFLGRDVPDVEMPNVNSRREMAERNRVAVGILLGECAWNVVRFGGYCALGGMVWGYLTRWFV